MTPRIRAWLVVVPSLLLVAGVVAFGKAQDAGSFSLAECVRTPADCADAELFIGYARVVRVEGAEVYTRSWMGDLKLAPWPADAPLPSPGLHVSALGAYAGGRTVAPHTVQSHPLRRRKELTGIAMLALWLLAGAAWIQRGWAGRDA